MDCTGAIKLPHAPRYNVGKTNFGPTCKLIGVKVIGTLRESRLLPKLSWIVSPFSMIPLPLMTHVPDCMLVTVEGN